MKLFGLVVCEIWQCSLPSATLQQDVLAPSAPEYNILRQALFVLVAASRK